MRDEAAQSRTGRLVVIAGCMFAGKTGRLIERLEVARESGRRVLAVKHPLDSRYEPTWLHTHDGRTFPAVSIADVAQVARLAAGVDVLGIDEAQFFGRKLVPVCRELVAGGRAVMVAGIDHDTWGQPFPPLPELKALADEVEQRYAKCGVCGGPATFHQRMVPVVDGNLVGGPREFEPRCPEHFAPLSLPAPVYE